MDIYFFYAAFQGDLPEVQKMLADGEALITDADDYGNTALLCATQEGSRSLPTLKWLLEEGGARITERNHDCYSALLLAAACGSFTTCQWLLEHGGADIAEVTNAGETVWGLLADRLDYEAHMHPADEAAAEVTALLRVMVLKGGPPTALLRVMVLKGDPTALLRVMVLKCDPKR
jgi:hypothetical protein